MCKNTWKIFINIGICNIINDYKITVKATDNRKVKTVKLFYKTVGDETEKDSLKTYYNGIGATGLLSFLSRKRKSNK